MNRRNADAESQFNRAVLGWFDAGQPACEIGRDIGIPLWQVYEFWKEGKLRGMIPAHARRAKRPSNNYPSIPEDAEAFWGEDGRASVGKRDLLLARLREFHGDDQMRKQDDMTDRLYGMEQRMSAINAGDFAS
jgi:hypothetical protein